MRWVLSWMYDIKITVAGSGDAFGSGGRHNTAFYVETTGFNFLIDCGAGILSALRKRNIAPSGIDAILITHFHGDHYGGLPFFLLDASVSKRNKRISIISPPGAQEKVSALLDLLYPGSQVLERLDVEFISYRAGEMLELSTIQVEPFQVIHTPESQPHGLRIYLKNKVLSYSGDTEWTDNLIPLSNNADLFFCECNFYKLQVKNHMNYSLLQKNRNRLSCKKLVLTHFDTEMLDHSDQVAEVCAYDGMVIEI